MRHSLLRYFRLRLIYIAAIFLLVVWVGAVGQSNDARFPTPVSSNEIVDSIAARDIGDSRLTDYFYTFTGLPGDLLITLESKNLNGDLDVFTAGELRPLLKITFYAESGGPSTKNIYLRRRESLILRVEARTPNDDPGTYRIRFTGSFEPISGGALEADSEKPGESNKGSGRTSDRKATRVSSVGARIDEPAEEVAASPTPKPTPDSTAQPKAEPVTEKTATKQPPRETTARTGRGRRPASRRTPPKPSTPAETTAGNTKDSASESAEKPSSETAAENATAPAGSTTTDKSAGEEGEKKTASAKKPEPYRRPSVRRTPVRKPPPNPAPEPENKARLVIEIKDGTRHEFMMSNIRKVTVENGEIVVVANDGVTQRISMSKVARMSIGP